MTTDITDDTDKKDFVLIRAHSCHPWLKSEPGYRDYPGEASRKMLSRQVGAESPAYTWKVLVAGDAAS